MNENLNTDTTETAVRRLPQRIKEVLADLIRESFTLVGVIEGSGAGAVAQGFGPDDIGTNVSLKLRQYGDVKVELSFNGHDIKAAEPEPSGKGWGPSTKPAGVIGQDYDREHIRQREGVSIPEPVDTAAQKLVKHGFRLVASNLDGLMRSLTLVKGRRVFGKETLIGIRAQITWIVD